MNTNVQDDSIIEDVAGPIAQGHDGSAIIGHDVTIGILLCY